MPLIVQDSSSILILEQLKSDLQESKIVLTTLLNIVLIIEETRRLITFLETI